MILLPIGTDVRPRKPPLANYLIVALNVAVFCLTDIFGGRAGEQVKALYTLDAARPLLFQYITYQFLHGDLTHLVGNMLFLFIFGNAVCDRMGGVGYALFYLAGGVFAGLTFVSTADNPILGASGSIAAVTTAFLALYPRVGVTLLFWVFIYLTTFSVPAMVVIVFKIILWDNILAPSLDRGAISNVAYSAHLGGYAFGFAVSLMMLLVRALPRHQFDIAALWDRRLRRGALAPAGRMARPVRVREIGSRPLDELSISPSERLRDEVLTALSAGRIGQAMASYLMLLELSPDAALPRAAQLELANHLAQAGRHDAAARAYELYLSAHPGSPDANQVRLLLGLIYNRYLGDYAAAARHLRLAAEGLGNESQRALAIDELHLAEARQF